MVSAYTDDVPDKKDSFSCTNVGFSSFFAGLVEKYANLDGDEAAEAIAIFFSTDDAVVVVLLVAKRRHAARSNN